MGNTSILPAKVENHRRLPLQLLSSEEQFGDYLIPITEFEKSRQKSSMARIFCFSVNMFHLLRVQEIVRIP
ncbi:hypothetical protein, partial [Escherichia coli]|uniref:hypothetical protein n=1 Tax=Escherichia coli TaxID=562 RepID=UPI001BB47609